ncbi:DUF2064 domain-containing protein [Halorhabdus rudnickae]|uniref:DUF2064 domain-containing protein n=1 Tax=Halorhabdus rudnickae TaxID=1775544 RepID=UPI0010832022|nr:DUF2064 domain-containing protein [Halorhabdus rudnickae]
MATVVIRADRPVEGAPLADLAAATPLTEDEAATLYRRALGDVVEIAETSGAAVLVTHPEDAQQQVRDAVEPALDDPDAVRFERQVGSTPAARLGNTVTHLLEEEGESSVGVLEPTAVLVDRSTIDQAAMTLRRHDVVVGPATAGGIYYAGFTDTIDFTDGYRPPMVETIVEGAVEAGLSADVLAPMPTLATPADLRSTLPILRARRAAGLAVPERTSDYLDELGLRTVETEEEGGMEIVRE